MGLLYGITGPSAEALDAESLKSKKRKTRTFWGNEIRSFLTDWQHMLHARSCARSCNNFLWFPHILKPPRPLKLPNYFSLLSAFFPILTSWAYFLEPIWAMVTRPVQGPCPTLATLSVRVSQVGRKRPALATHPGRLTGRPLSHCIISPN